MWICLSGSDLGGKRFALYFQKLNFIAEDIAQETSCKIEERVDDCGLKTTFVSDSFSKKGLQWDDAFGRVRDVHKVSSTIVN
ncbi:hypothetical protein L596_000202 [Steinernema carpocapsae]|uniref:Uncharacterized protein n=1 Tax=Steinernema carpocapsae TaxID=34508 RepID=A0A4U8UH79_STECR|nr:hypothetical protein L596_000202 [Steinernema carpocapsae]